MNHPSWLEINLDTLRANVRWWQKLLQGDAADPSPILAAVVKADAYGLGAVPISRALAESGVSHFIVYSLDQARQLLAAGVNGHALVLMPTTRLGRAACLRQALGDERLHFSVDDPRQLRLLARAADRLHCRLPVHLHLDTGMSRAGLSAVEFRIALRAVAQSPSLRLAGLYTHLATAATDVGFMDEQLGRLDAAVAEHRQDIPPGTLVHVSSTYAACRHRRYHRHLVRIGLGLYGYGPEAVASRLLPHEPPPRPIVRWLSRIVHVQRYPAGAPVGYVRSFTLPRDSTLGVVPAGYGDGYPVALSNKSTVRVLRADGTVMGHAPQRGRVNMDQIIIDLTDLPDAKVGTTVELLSAEHGSPCSATALAALARTNGYEILCRLSPRLPRVFVGRPLAPGRRTSKTVPV